MKKVMLAKFGFVRWPEEDFSDDGNYFTCYRAGKAVRVSKLVADGKVYLSIDSSCGKGTVPYEVYIALPNYRKANWDYNGVSIETLTETDLQEFYNACIAYEEEYENAEASLVYPTLDELQKKANQLYMHKKAEITHLKDLFDSYAFDAIMKLSPHELKTCQEYLRRLHTELENLDPVEQAKKFLGTAGSFDFIKREYSECYYYKYIVDLFKRYCMYV